MSALVDGVQAVIPVQLLYGIFTGIAVAAMYLNGEAVGFQTPLRGPGFDNRCENFEEQIGLAPSSLGAERIEAEVRAALLPAPRSARA